MTMTDWNRKRDALRRADEAYRQMITRLVEHVTYECDHVASGQKCEHR